MNAEVEEQCAALQEQELEVLQAIYPEAISILAHGELKIEVPIELDSRASVRVVDDSGAQSAASSPIQLSRLPSLLLCLKLPPTYPIAAPPQLDSVYSTHNWLHSRLTAKVDQQLCTMWTAGEEGVLDAWIEWIRGGQMLRDIGIRVGDELLVRHPTPHLLAPLLVEYDAKANSDAFDSTAYACSICLNSVKGARCIQLKCSHVFCRDCLHDYWSLAIQEGTVSSVGCADQECVKKGVEASAEDVRRVVSDDLVERWQWLVLKREAERDPTIMSCPMQTCQLPVPRSQGMDPDDSSGWSRFRQCQSCGYSFCSFCKRTWHGPVTACAANTSLAIVTEYMALEEGSPARRAMEVKYGARTLQRLVAAYEEEQANKKYFESETRGCPGCGVSIQKSLGCNHMTCARCGQHFCYLCSEKLIAANPYIHFSTRGQTCYNRLFDEKDILENEWGPVVGFEGLGMWD